MKDKIIVVEQKPIIKYGLLEKISGEVVSKIESLSLDNIEPSEDTLKTIKTTRTELGKEFKTLEEQRKMVKEIVLKDYNDFEDTYKRFIATHYKDADAKLKSLVYTVEDKILAKKIDGIKEYFNEVNEFDFVSFEDMQLKIIKSRSDKNIKEEIDAYLSNVVQDINTISTIEHSDRVLAKYQISKDLNSSISQTNIEVQREEQIKAQNEARAKAEQERKERIAQERKEFDERQAMMQTSDIAIKDEVSIVEEAEPIVEKIEIFKTSFKVSGTKQQLSDLKKYIIEKGIKIL